MLIERLTFGAFCGILDLKLPDPGERLWNPHIIRNLGFATADRKHKRFFHYLELSPQTDESAWDTRSIWVRVAADIRRDYAHTVQTSGQFGAFVSRGGLAVPVLSVADRLSLLKRTIDEFQDLLDQHANEDESVFHSYLREHPILLDIYGTPVYKPRWYYPANTSPLGKRYVEPDFVIKYPGNAYRLVELEKPGKQIVTRAGHPRQELGQAAFQIAEWLDYIAHHYASIEDDYPAICTNHSSMIVISRPKVAARGNPRDIRRWMEVIKLQYRVHEVLLYDDLLVLAREALIRLSELASEVG